jgi:anti-sigma factor RsiW
MSHIPVNQLLAAYALGACEQLESAAIEAHLSRCAACAADVQPLQAAADSLGIVLATPPPAGLRNKVLRRARAFPRI